MDVIGTVEAARRLGTTTPTIRSLARKGLLVGFQRPRGSRFSWRIDERSVEKYLRDHGRFDERPAGQSRLERVEAELSNLREAFDRGVTSADKLDKRQPLEAVERERDDLRAKAVMLEEALARFRSVSELQRQADEERAVVVEHLTAAVAASGRADALRQQALDELENSLSAAVGPGHLGDMR